MSLPPAGFAGSVCSWTTCRRRYFFIKSVGLLMFVKSWGVDLFSAVPNSASIL